MLQQPVLSQAELNVPYSNLEPVTASQVIRGECERLTWLLSIYYSFLSFPRELSHILLLSLVVLLQEEGREGEKRGEEGT
jgi:hypothetical protein